MTCHTMISDAARSQPFSTDVQEAVVCPNTMRAAVLFGPRDLRVIDCPVPSPGPGEALIKVAMCGTCGSDLKIYDGHFPVTLPYAQFIPGHEWTGTVVALGDNVDEVAVGDRSVLKPITVVGGATTAWWGNTRRVSITAMPPKATAPRA